MRKRFEQWREDRTSGTGSVKEARVVKHRIVIQPFRPVAPNTLSMPEAEVEPHSMGKLTCVSAGGPPHREHAPGDRRGPDCPRQS
jgi:hypothetical protein